jgi:hypothetical protein
MLDLAVGESVADLVQMIFATLVRSGIRTGSMDSYDVLQAAIFYIIAAFALRPSLPPKNEAEKAGARIASDVLENFGSASLPHHQWMTSHDPAAATQDKPRQGSIPQQVTESIEEQMRRHPDSAKLGLVPPSMREIAAEILRRTGKLDEPVLSIMRDQALRDALPGSKAELSTDWAKIEQIARALEVGDVDGALAATGERRSDKAPSKPSKQSTRTPGRVTRQ